MKSLVPGRTLDEKLEWLISELQRAINHAIDVIYGKSEQ